MIRQHLRDVRDLMWPLATELGLAYRGPADFVLREGRWWKPAPRPGRIRRGAPRACFGNAIAAGVLYRLEYVEGFALAPTSGAEPVPHAWNIDGNGNVIDTTWPIPGRAYLGVAFSIERADDATWNGDAHVIHDYKRGWPLLATKWRGETAPEPSWEPSPMLLALRARVAGDEGEVIRQEALASAEVGRESHAQAVMRFIAP